MLGARDGCLRDKRKDMKKRKRQKVDGAVLKVVNLNKFVFALMKPTLRWKCLISPRLERYIHQEFIKEMYLGIINSIDPVLTNGTYTGYFR